MTMNVGEIVSNSSGSSTPRRCNSAEPKVFHELRHEIHLVKFPEDEDKLRKKLEKKMKKQQKKATRQKSVTITMPDGKKVKQRKSENESMTPCPLKLALKNTQKGDVYVRADGKIVRLVKKKDKKRKEKALKKQFKAEMKRLRHEAEMKAAAEEEEERQRHEQEEVATLKKPSIAVREQSWQEVEEEQERAYKQHWEGDKATQTDETKRISYQEAKRVFVVKDKVEEEEEEEEESTTTTSGDDDVESVASAPDCACLRDSSTLTFGTYTTAESTQSDDEVEEEDDDDGEDHPTDQELKVFYVSLDEVDEEDLPFVKRMSRRSIEILAKADEMRRKSRLIEKVCDIRDKRFHDVNVPLHPTQSNNYKPKGGSVRRTNTTPKKSNSTPASSGGPGFRRTFTR